MEVDWVRSIRDRCADRRVPFFFKQWGGLNKKAAGRELDGRTWDELPFGIRTVEPEESDERQTADCVGC
jgi:protein gp37